MPTYHLELWNPKTRRYEVIWTGPEQYALTMMNKSYNARSTRRLVKVTVEILYAARKGQYVEKK